MSNNQEFIDFLNQKEETEDEEVLQDDTEEVDSENISVNIPLNGSPLYPRIYTGDSAKPLSTGLFPETEVGDDNITNTWRGLMSFYG